MPEYSTRNNVKSDELHQLLQKWNDTKKNYPLDKCIHQLFESQVERTPDRVAVIYENKQLLYKELNQRANQVAHHLRSLGVKPEVLVGICFERSLEMVVGLLGILKAGGAYIPLDPSYPQERIVYMLSDSQMSVVLTQKKLVLRLPDQEARVVCLDTDWHKISLEKDENPTCGVSPSNLAYVIYTSGSTGKPKGVMIPHRAVINHMFWMQETFPLTEVDRVLQKTPFSFDASIWEFYAPLLAGSQLVMARPGGNQDGAYLIKVIKEQKITILQLVPSFLRMLLEINGIETCTSLRRVFCGGEALPVKLQERLNAKLDATLHNLYGPTEACIDATFYTCSDQEHHQQIVPIGRPISNTQVYILDQYLQPVPIGVPGELYIGGASLARGYLNRPDFTNDKFIPNPFSDEPEARLYKTGDLTRYLPDGNIVFLGRMDNQVKIRGVRIAIEEVESTLEQHPQVSQAVVIAREDQLGDKRLVGYVVLNSGQNPTTNKLRNFLQQKLPDYMIPSTFLILNKLPLTPNNKIDRNALPDPDQSRPNLSVPFVLPRTIVEQQIADIWTQFLELEYIGIHDDFFELGGHSLIAPQIISRLQQTFEIEFQLRILFELPTVAEIAERIETIRWTTQNILTYENKKNDNDVEIEL